MKEIGYLGILGIDFILTNNELYFTEVNPRFQGATKQLEKLLKESKLPSLFKYNYLTFAGEDLPSSKEMKNSIFKQNN